MKTSGNSFLLALLMSILVNISMGQHYEITFTGSGAATTVDSVKVENLSLCLSLTMKGTDTLYLAPSTGIHEAGNPHENCLNVNPNPFPGACRVEFESISEGVVNIGLYDMSGKSIIQKKLHLQKGHSIFHLRGMNCGAYLLKVTTEKKLYTAKLISNGIGQGSPEMEVGKSPIGKEKKAGFFPENTGNGFGGIKSFIYMMFYPGDTLKLTGKSGIYSTVKMLFPSSSQIVDFPFTGCTDIDGNHYAVVQIGSQLWMQQNLKTTKYRDGSDIPNVTDSAAWGSITTGAWCDYHNLPAEGAYYGHLYNFYTVADVRNICPSGWHVPSHSEWNIMEKFLDNTVDTTALGGTGIKIGRILKEGCETRWAYMDSTYGWNSAGFTALCTNYRTASGSWSQAPDDNHDDCFWTATTYNTNSAWFRSLRWCFSDIYSLFPMKKAGYSVRCVKD